jgi:hypothetical protein
VSATWGLFDVRGAISLAWERFPANLSFGEIQAMGCRGNSACSSGKTYGSRCGCPGKTVMPILAISAEIYQFGIAAGTGQDVGFDSYDVRSFSLRCPAGERRVAAGTILCSTLSVYREPVTWANRSPACAESFA